MVETTNFIKNIVDDNVTQKVHDRFTRYGKGDFEKDPFEVKKQSNNFRVYSGFEYINFLQWFVSKQFEEKVEIKGPIASVDDLSPRLDELGIDYETKTRRGKKGDKFVIQKTKVTPEKYEEIVNEFFEDYIMIQSKTSKGYLKTDKTTTPKPNKSSERFVKIKLDNDFYESFKNDYLFDLDETDWKKADIHHTYDINEVHFDEDLIQEDPYQARMEAKRAGKIIRKIILDDEKHKEYKINFKV